LIFLFSQKYQVQGLCINHVCFHGRKIVLEVDYIFVLNILLFTVALPMLRRGEGVTGGDGPWKIHPDLSNSPLWKLTTSLFH
jgi:hypothetical protein